LINPTLTAIRNLEGSATSREIEEYIIFMLDLPARVAEVPHSEESLSKTELGYQLQWARTHLRDAGLIQSSSNGVWTLTPEAQDLEEISPGEVLERTREAGGGRSGATQDPSLLYREGQASEAQSWKSDLHAVLTEKLSASAFERLTVRLLRELGFVHLEVTGKSGDGGIDGKGRMRINGILTFNIVFQCKRYRGSVSVREVRDFRGAAIGRADRGLMISTGSFTKAAEEEARRDGAPPIDLVDGEDLAEHLKRLGLGVEVRTIKRTVVKRDWFEAI
jgi:restriction system protein